jgi:membrane associated rhomboid family serine protease
MIEEHHIEFLQAVWSRRPTFTYVFFGLNLLIFLLMAFAGGSMNDATLVAFGAKFNSEIARGQWWRFVTPIFIHIGLLHLGFNSWALWVIGPQVEKLYGAARFVILYLGTGIAGVWASYRFHPETASAGASGAIFGLFGVLLVFGIRYRDSIPPHVKRAVGTGVLPVILINLFIGFSLRSFVDNSAHVGGLLAGAALALVVPFKKPGSETPGIFKAVQWALLALVAVCFFEVATHYNGPELSARNLPRGLTQVISAGTPWVQEFVDAMNNAQQTFESTSRELESANTAKLGQLKADVTKSIDQLRKVGSRAQKPDGFKNDFLRVMEDQYALIQDIERSGTFTLSHSQQLKANVQKYEQIMAEFSKWVDEEGSKYGIQQGKDR